jgi:hypothetical protein
MLIHIPLIILFVATLFLYFGNFTAESWTQTTSEFESRLIFGNTTAVNDNFTIEVNENLVVSLALIDTNTTDQTFHQDGIHFMSVVCPIRSPVVVLPLPYSLNSLEHDNKSANLTEIEGIVYCQASNISDINSTQSINEQLLDAKLATLHKKYCNNQTFAFSFLSRISEC